MKRFHISRAFVAALVGVIAIPTVMTGVNVTQPLHRDIYNSARNDAARVRTMRRNYWKAVDIYKDLVRVGFDDMELSPPNVNDVDSISFYINEEYLLKAAAPTSEEELAEGHTPKEQYDALTETYRDLLDGYMTYQYCPLTLKQFHLSGFYELCTKLLEERLASVTENLLQRSAFLRGKRRADNRGISLKDRLRVLENTLLNATNGSNRPQGSVGQRRPRLDITQ